jgi:hypothetical protein
VQRSGQAPAIYARSLGFLSECLKRVLKSFDQFRREADGCTMFHNLRIANFRCRRKAKMSALSKVGMSVFFLLVVRFGGCGSNGCGADEQTRDESH